MMVEELMPEGTPEYMLPAWVSCLSWAIKHPGMLEEFREATGNNYQPPRSGLDRMVDEATGADRAFIEAFVAWFNSNVWGE